MSEKLKVGYGFELEVPKAYQQLFKEAEKMILASISKFPKSKKMYELLDGDPEVNAGWDMADYITTAKLRYNDRGEVHAKVTAANALRMLDLLIEGGVKPDILWDGGDLDDCYLVVMTGALLHDIGNQVHRELHNLSGVYLAIPILERLMSEVYSNREIMYEMRARILHSIYAHEWEVDDLTLEAALVGVADGTDMTKGRGRMSFETGNVNIHNVSAMSIERVVIRKGQEKPIRIEIEISNSAGIFQIQETLGKKIFHSPLWRYIELVAVAKPKGERTDSRIIQRLILTDAGFQAL